MKRIPPLGAREAWIIHGVVSAGTIEPASAPRHVRVDLGGLSVLLSAGHAEHASDPYARPKSGLAALEREAIEALAHNDLLTAYAVCADVVPLRYGAAVVGPAAALALMRPHKAHYARVLRRVSGCVEYVLRVSLPAGAEAPRDALVNSRTGQGAGRALRGVRDALGPVRLACLGEITAAARGASRELISLPAASDHLLDLALLVPRERIDALLPVAERGRSMASACGLAMSMIGPWPAYSFTGVPGTAV